MIFRSQPVHRHRRLRVLLVAALAAAGLAVPTAAPTASAAGVNVLPASERTVAWSSSFGNTGDVALPDCNSINVASGKFATNNSVRWRVRSSIGTGSTILVGTTWTITGEIDGEVLYGGTIGNDGPDPLTLTLQPSGPVAPGAPVQAGEAGLLNVPHWAGGGSTGPIAPLGQWGYSFDSNSSPTAVVSGGDGTDAKITVTMRATAPGEIKMSELKIGGWDATPIAGAVSCALPLDWYWTVIPAVPASAQPEFTRTDSRYTNDIAGEATTGDHAIVVLPLANEEDRNSPGLGDTSKVRLRSWSTSSEAGGTVSCGDQAVNGATPTAENFTSLAAGPCLYTPPVGFDGQDRFDYQIVQRSDLTSSLATAYIDVVPNSRPNADDVGIAVAAGDDQAFDLLDVVSDPDGDPLVCSLASGPTPAGEGELVINSDCSATWTNIDPGFTGSVDFTYRLCDTHPTIPTSEMAPAGARAGTYAAGDLDAENSRRCAIGDGTINVLAGLIIPPTGKADSAKVDAGYAADGIGVYRVVIDVLANDFDGNGPTPTEIEILTAPDPAKGTAVVMANKVVFSPANGFAGPVTFTYRLCEDPDAQNPPYPGLPYCGVGTVNVTVVGNRAPLALDDVLGTVDRSQRVVDADGNDAEPDNDNRTCQLTGTQTPGAFTNVQLGVGCVVTFDPADDFSGPASIEYRVCDDHTLLSITNVPNPYGTDGRQPGDPASRCSVAEITMTVEVVEPLQPPADPTGAPTCTADVLQVPWNSESQLDVLGNDTDVDGKGQPSSLTLLQPDEGATQQGGDIEAKVGKLAYMPAKGFVGWDSTSYSAIDTDLQGCTAGVEILVIGDLDGDGIPNGTDPDVDGDGIPNDQDPDDDGDGIPDTEDNDDNGDGLPDASSPVPAPPNTGGGLTGGLPVTGSGTGATLLVAFALALGGLLMIAWSSTRRRRAPME